MDIFISWSGNRSKAVAAALRAWLPKVIQSTKPWMSDSDILTGQRWDVEVATHLEKSKVGIICLTPENLNAAWILFEAGALSKTLDRTYVCPYLYEIGFSEIPDPLSHFQAANSDRDGTSRLIKTINAALGRKSLEEPLVAELFDTWWSKLEEKLKEIPPLEVDSRAPSQSEMIQQTYEMIRQLART